jgi:hypothetical protein
VASTGGDLLLDVYDCKLCTGYPFEPADGTDGSSSSPRRSALLTVQRSY